MRYIFATLSHTGAIEHRIVETKDFDATRDEFRFDGDLIGFAWEPTYGHDDEIKQNLTERLQRKWAAKTEVSA
jgi:hypothetical protein